MNEIAGRKIVEYETGFYIREWSNDLGSMRDINSYKCLDYKDRTVMDIGGCFGGFCYRAKQWGAHKVISYEADNNNFQLLQHNIKKLNNVYGFNKAVISGNEKVCDFYPARGKSLGVGSRLHRRGRVRIEVPAANFLEELEIFKPDTIKMDIEGGEYDLLFNTPLPKFVKQIVMEIHLLNEDMKYKQCPELVKIFKNWKVIKPHKLTYGNLTTTAAWSRL